MKTIYTFVTIVLSITLAFSQTYGSHFEDGTLQNWTNVDDTTNSMSVQGTTGYMYLEKLCDGSNSAVGEMAIINKVDFNGDLSCDDPSGIDCWAGFSLRMRNSNAFDLHLRFGFRNTNGSTVASDPGIIIPANSDWNYFELWNDTQLFVVDGTESVDDVLADVQEIILFHNQNLAYEGELVVGSLELDYIDTIFLLSANDELLQQTSIYPNPMSDALNIKLPSGVEATATLYNVLGQAVKQSALNSGITTLETSNLESGVYFITIKTETATFTKKVVKR